jgi:hypothetical protein
MQKRSSPSLEKPEIIFITVVLLLAIAFYAFYIIRTSFSINGELFFTLRDDAMISMRYAKHLANGFGFVWNIGEAPVQGFTNLGWALFMAVLHLIPIAESKISLLVMIFSGILLVGSSLLAYKASITLDPEARIAPKIAMIITAFYYPLVYWSLRGMEVGVQTFLICALAVIVVQPTKTIKFGRALLIGLLVLLAIVIRLDIVLQVSLILVFVFYKYVYQQRNNIITLSPIWLLFLAATVGVPLFQSSYFGSVMPNTYYLKVSGVTLAERLNVGLQTLVEFGLRDFIAPLLIILAGLIVFQDLRKKEVLLFLALFLIQCSYSVYVGGDYAESLLGGWNVDAANRFITNGMPFIFILFGIVVERLIKRIALPTGERTSSALHTTQQTANIAIVIGLAVLLVISGEPWFEWSIYNAPGLDLDTYKTKLALHIRDYTDEEAVIAVHGAGQIPYYSGRNTIDLLGKNDPIIANAPPAPGIPFFPGHNKWDYDYSIMELRPDLIADEWGFLSEFLADKLEYSRLENGIWVRNDSTLIDLEKLAQDYQQP